jgi:hypothetical protein
MTVQVYNDDLMHKFHSGDIVRFNLDECEMYTYHVPKPGTIGIIESQIHNYGLEQALGVQVPMSVVQWEDGRKITVFSHDIEKIEGTDEEMFKIVKRLKKLTPYTGEHKN